MATNPAQSLQHISLLDWVVNKVTEAVTIAEENERSPSDRDDFEDNGSAIRLRVATTASCFPSLWVLQATGKSATLTDGRHTVLVRLPDRRLQLGKDQAVTLTRATVFVTPYGPQTQQFQLEVEEEAHFTTSQRTSAAASLAGRNLVSVTSDPRLGANELGDKTEPLHRLLRLYSIQLIIPDLQEWAEKFPRRLRPSLAQAKRLYRTFRNPLCSFYDSPLDDKTELNIPGLAPADQMKIDGQPSGPSWWLRRISLMTILWMYELYQFGDKSSDIDFRDVFDRVLITSNTESSRSTNSDCPPVRCAPLWHKVLAVWFVLHNHIAFNLEEVRKDRELPSAHIHQHLAADAPAGSSCPLEASGIFRRGFECACNPDSLIHHLAPRFGSILVALSSPEEIQECESELFRSIDFEEFNRLNGVPPSLVWAYTGRKSQHESVSIDKYIRQMGQPKSLRLRDWIATPDQESEVTLQMYKYVSGQLKSRPATFPTAESRDSPSAIILTTTRSLQSQVINPLKCTWWPRQWQNVLVPCHRATGSSRCWHSSCTSKAPPKHHRCALDGQNYLAIHIRMIITCVRESVDRTMKDHAAQMRIMQNRGTSEKPLTMINF